VDVSTDVSTQAGLSCPSCGAPLQAGDRFCERCGARLDDPQPQPGSAVEHRVELDLTIAAAVSDQGLVHRRNEDSFHLEVAGERNVAAVVCDGISSASAGNVAARNAAEAAGAILAQAVADPDMDASQAIFDAIQAAVDAVIQVEWTTRVKRVDPSCTLVSAVCRGGDITVGWVGDSRAYWFDGEEARQLTVDDSFAEEGIAKGLLTP
jgi:PPM family protein phosphatase